MREDRLLILADHLLNGQLGHKRFDFSTFNMTYPWTKEDKEWRPVVRGCGTNGCAIGECPIIWPNNWKFEDRGGIVAPVLDNMLSKEGAKYWFDLEDHEVCYLFFPKQYSGFGVLDVKATRKQVAKHVINFVKDKLNKIK